MSRGLCKKMAGRRNGKASGAPRADKHTGAIGPNGQLVPILSANIKAGYKPREPKYSPELAIEICRRISRGESLKAICESDDAMPSRSGFLDWVDADRDGLAERYARAREALMDYWADEIITISDDQNAEPNDRRIRVETRKWLMSKLAWRRYGDKLMHSGDPENPMVVLHKRVDVAPLSPSELDALDQLTRARLGPVIDVDATPVPPESD
jgi:hypothetical protein